MKLADGGVAISGLSIPKPVLLGRCSNRRARSARTTTSETSVEAAASAATVVSAATAAAAKAESQPSIAKATADALMSINLYRDIISPILFTSAHRHRRRAGIRNTPHI